MSQQRLIGWAVALFALVVVLFNTLYVVDQRKQAVVLRFGNPRGLVNAQGTDNPGLKMKAPFLDKVILLDKRNLALEAQKEEIIAVDQERLVVDAFVRYRISDPLLYYRTLHNETIAQDRIERLVNSSLRQVLGSATNNDIISGRRGQLMTQARDDVAKRAKASKLGIEIIDLRIKRADLPRAWRPLPALGFLHGKFI